MSQQQDNFDDYFSDFSISDIDLTQFYSTDSAKDEKIEELRKKIEQFKWFYLKNEKFDIIALRKKTVYEKFKSDKGFIGNKFKEVFQAEEDKCKLVCQLVNEREKMKATGKVLFFRELYLSTRKNVSVQKLFKMYIGDEDDTAFAINEKGNVDYYRWCFLVHKNRFNYILNCLKGIDLELDLNEIKNVKNYNDVFDYCKIHTFY